MRPDAGSGASFDLFAGESAFPDATTVSGSARVATSRPRRGQAMARRPVGPGTRLPAALEPGRTSWGAVAGLMGAGVVAAAQIGGAAAALPVLEGEFGLSAATAAWYLSTVS